MADYWKSQPKKFCQYCKCWIADNKPSVEFHERGKNHKQNVAAKIEEIKKKSIDKAKKEDRMSKEFAAMEDAALKAYEEDMKRLQAESGATESEPQPQAQAQPKQQTRKEKKKKKPSPASSSSNSESDAWVEGFTDDGLLYYYNTVTGESQWEKPEGLQSQSGSTAQAGEQSESGSPWMEAVSPDGFTYYYNTETGESSWGKPEGYPSEGDRSAAQEDDDDPSPPKPEPLSEGESSSNGEKEKSVDTDEPKQPKIPKISFRKRKEEKSEPSEKDDDGKEVEGDVGAEGQGDESSGDSSKSGPAKEEKKETPAKKPRINPYGMWEQIQEEEDPYENVDLQLPQVDTGDVVAPPTELAPEPKPKFRERKITSLGDEGGTSTTFRKRKAENGKSRSLRQRGKDD